MFYFINVNYYLINTNQQQEVSQNTIHYTSTLIGFLNISSFCIWLYKTFLIDLITNNTYTKIHILVPIINGWFKTLGVNYDSICNLFTFLAHIIIIKVVLNLNMLFWMFAIPQQDDVCIFNVHKCE